MRSMKKQIDTSFDEFKETTLQKLNESLKKGEVDEKVVSILDHINGYHSYITTSSCAGRIILLQLPEVGDKKKACFLGRWHDPITMDHIQVALSKYKEGQLWFIAQSPIFHICCRSFEDADRLLKTGISSGFKNSGFKSSTPRIIVELLSTERMDVPLAKQDFRFLVDEYLEFLVKMGNELLIRSQKKLDRLNQLVIKINE